MVLQAMARRAYDVAGVWYEVGDWAVFNYIKLPYLFYKDYNIFNEREEEKYVWTHVACKVACGEDRQQNSVATLVFAYFLYFHTVK